MRNWKPGVLCAAVVLTGCDSGQDSPVEAVSAHAHAAPHVADAALVAQALNDLRAATASWHNEKQLPAGYDTPVGCIDERIMGVSPGSARGMGYHLADLALMDDHIDLLQPEVLVYGKNPANGKLRLAGFDYFIPASEMYPSPGDGGTPPQILGMDYTWSEPHGGWMFHIWPWWHNPDGMFDNFNPAVPTCDCQLNPGDFSCMP
jgi:hypothetical protein